MFRKGQDARGSVTTLANGKRGMLSVIGQDMTISGNIQAASDLHIDGQVDGDVACGNLVQGAESTITGSIEVDTARIAGTIRGSVKAREITIERSARIEGDVDYEVITVETGARIDGRMQHRAPVEAAPGDNVLFMGTTAEQG